MLLDHNCSIIVGVARSQTKRSSSYAKCVIGLKLGGRLALNLSDVGIGLQLLQGPSFFHYGVENLLFSYQERSP